MHTSNCCYLRGQWILFETKHSDFNILRVFIMICRSSSHPNISKCKKKQISAHWGFQKHSQKMKAFTNVSRKIQLEKQQQLQILKCLVSKQLFSILQTQIIVTKSSIIIWIFTAPDTSDVLPKLTPLKDQIVLEGQPAQFKTQILPAKLKPTIQWYREGALIPESPDFQVNSRILNNLILRITYNFKCIRLKF